MRKFKVTASSNSSTLKVTPYVINKGQSGEYYGLKNAEDNQVLTSAPNNWKSKKGAIAWAKKKGYEVVESACGKKSVKADWVSKGKKSKISKSFELGDFFLFELGKDFIGISINNSYPEGKSWLGARTISCSDAKGLFDYLRSSLTDDATWNQIERAVANSGFDAKINTMGNFVSDKEMRKPVTSSYNKKSVKASSDGWKETDYSVSKRKFNVKASKSAKRRKAIKASFDENGFAVTGYLGSNRSGAYADRYFGPDEWSEVESYAHELLMQGLYVNIIYFKTGDQINIDPDVYAENFDGEFVVTNEIADFRDKVWKSMGIGASTKRRNGSKVTAAWYEGGDIVMYFNGEKIYEGQPGADMYDAILPLCQDDETRLKFQEWCNQFGDPLFDDEYGDASETAYTFCELIYYDFVDDENNYEDGDGILDFEIFPATEEVTGTKSVKCASKIKRKAIKADTWESSEEAVNDMLNDSYEYDGFEDSDMLEYVDAFLQDPSSGAWLSTNRVIYNGPDDWSVDAGLDPEAVETDFWFFLDDMDHDLYEEMLEADLANPLDEDSVNYTYNQNAVNGNEFYIQLYPGNRQISAPQVDFDNQYLTPEWLERLSEIRDAYEDSRIRAYTDFQNGLGSFLANGITASTEGRSDAKSVQCASENISATEYNQMLADMTLGILHDDGYEGIGCAVTDEALSFYDGTEDDVVYIQPTDEITPILGDEDADAEELAAAVKNVAGKAVEATTYDDFEPITGDDSKYGWTSNGDPIDESTVDELYRIAEREVLPTTELAKVDEYATIMEDTFEYYASSPYVGVTYTICATFDTDDIDVVSYALPDAYHYDFRGGKEVGELEFYIYVKGNEIDKVELIWNSSNLNPDNYDMEAIEEYVKSIAKPAAEAIYNAITNI